MQLSTTIPLKWTGCPDLPGGMEHPQAVLLNNKVYVGGGDTASDELAYTICSFDLLCDDWRKIHCPARLSALTIYQSQIVLVGGVKKHPKPEVTNELWLLDDQETWSQLQPPMPTARLAASAVGIDVYLIVAGGWGSGELLDVVELFNNNQWSCLAPLPKPCADMKMLCYNDIFYLCGGRGQGKSVFSTSLSAVTTRLSSSAQTIWETLPDVPYPASCIAILQSTLVAIGGGYLPQITASLHIYCPQSEQWVKMATELPEAIRMTCSISLPTDEIIIIGGFGNNGRSRHVYKGTVKK